MTRANGPRQSRRAKILWGAAAFVGGSVLCLLTASAQTPPASATATATATAKPTQPLVIEPTAPQETPGQPADPSTPFVRQADAQLSELKLLINKSSVLETKTPYKRVSVSQPDIADVNLLGPGRLLVTGKKAGQTQVIVWDDGERAQVMDVTVQVDVKSLS